MSASSFDQLVVFLSRLTKQHGAPPELKQTIAGGRGSCQEEVVLEDLLVTFLTLRHRKPDTERDDGGGGPW